LSQELDTAAAGSLGGFLRGKRGEAHTLPPGTPCANCATPLQGPWCHACGQLGEDFHRSTTKLLLETIEGLFHFDGRLWRTLPDLALRPGRLTRSYLDGHRAPQIPPLRLFLVVLLLVFLVGGLPRGKAPPETTVTHNGTSTTITGSGGKTLSELSPAEKAELKKTANKVQVKLGSDRSDTRASDWLKRRLDKVIDEPERFYLVLESWGERFAFLMLPLSTLLLAVAFVWRREFFLFDHVIFSLHSLSFMGLVICVAMLIPSELGGILLLAAPVHLFVHLRGVYRTGVLMTLLRMGWLFVGTLVGVTFIVLGLLAVGLNAMS
jgi:hypothetical protein